VPGQDRDVISKGINLFPNAAKKKLAVSSWQIPTPDATGKEDIASKEDLLFLPKEAEASRAMPRHKENLEIDATELERIGLVDQEARRNGFDLPGKAEFQEKIAFRNHWLSVRMVADLAPVFPLNPRRVPDVINMAMGKEKQLHFVPGFGKPRGSLLGRVDQNTCLRKKKTIRVKEAAGECIDEHADRVL
jgi:hypothetical protein